MLYNSTFGEIFAKKAISADLKAWRGMGSEGFKDGLKETLKPSLPIPLRAFRSAEMAFLAKISPNVELYSFNHRFFEGSQNRYRAHKHKDKVQTEILMK